MAVNDVVVETRALAFSYGRQPLLRSVELFWVLNVTVALMCAGEFERAALLRDQIMEVKNGAGITKIEPRRRPVKYSRNSGRRRSRV